MSNATILTISQIYERYPYDNTKEAKLARAAIEQEYGVAVIQCRFFSRLNNTPFLTDVSIDALEREIPGSEINIRFIIDNSLIDNNQIVVAFKRKS